MVLLLVQVSGNIDSIQTDINFFLKVTDKRKVLPISEIKRNLYNEFHEVEKDLKKEESLGVFENKEVAEEEKVVKSVEEESGKVGKQIIKSTEEEKIIKNDEEGDHTARSKKEDEYVKLKYDEESGWSYVEKERNSEIVKAEEWGIQQQEEDFDDEVEEDLDFDDEVEEEEVLDFEENSEEEDFGDEIDTIDFDDEIEEDNEDDFNFDDEIGEDESNEEDLNIFEDYEESEEQQSQDTYIEEEDLDDLDDDFEEDDERGLMEEFFDEKKVDRKNIVTMGSCSNDSWRKESKVGKVKDLWSFNSMQELDSEEAESLSKAMSEIRSTMKFEVKEDLSDMCRFNIDEEEEVIDKVDVVSREGIPKKEEKKEEPKVLGSYRTLRELVKAKPGCSIEEAVKYFPKKEVDKDISLGRVFKKNNKLFI